jgi:hypothetical protein
VKHLANAEHISKAVQSVLALLRINERHPGAVAINSDSVVRVRIPNESTTNMVSEGYMDVYLSFVSGDELKVDSVVSDDGRPRPAGPGHVAPGTRANASDWVKSFQDTLTRRR